jgi:Zn-dependent protease
MGQQPNMIYLASIWAIPIIIAITFHEAAHGFVARLLGDETAWRLGRVSLNPLKHIDPVGTILLPGFLLLLRSPFLFGYAKPVPINFRALRNPRRDMVWVGNDRSPCQRNVIPGTRICCCSDTVQQKFLSGLRLNHKAM